MCADICPQNAICFVTDDEGFWYPKVDESKCVRCGLCVKQCPALIEENNDNDYETKVYAAWSKNENVRMESTSGGVFWELADYFMDMGGIVVGCAYDEDWKSASHILAHNKEELEKIRGSKYFQSDTGEIYKKVKAYLDKEVRVLFCGAPCQIAAMKSFLGKEYENLYCMDFICISINSPKAFKAYIDELEQQNNARTIMVHLKNKKNGWQSLASQVTFDNGKESLKNGDEDWWVKGFLYGDLYTRESCYNCKYKVLPRKNADITVGDFWGIQNQKKDDMFKGISVVLVNTKKGSRLFDEVNDRLIIKRRSLEEAVSGNPALLHNRVKQTGKRKFFKLVDKGVPFSEAVKKSAHKNIKACLERKMSRILGTIKKGIKFLCRHDIAKGKFVFYNFVSSKIVRDRNVFLVPYKGAVLDLDRSARIYIKGANLEVGINRLKGSRAETHLRMSENAIWNCNNGCGLFYNTVLEIKKDAIFTSGFFTANGGSVIIAHKQIEFGEDVMIGRNVIIYDSDFHSIMDEKGEACNPPRPVKIDDHVWLTSNIIVQKGVTIEKDSLVAAYTVVNKSMPGHSIIAGHGTGHVVKDYVEWERESCPMDM